MYSSPDRLTQVANKGIELNSLGKFECPEFIFLFASTQADLKVIARACVFAFEYIQRH